MNRADLDARSEAALPDVWAVIEGAVDRKPEMVTQALDRIQQAGGDPLVFGALCAACEVVKLVWKDDLGDDGMVIVDQNSRPCDCPGDVHDHADSLATARFLAAYCNDDKDTPLAIWDTAIAAGEDRHINLVFGIVAAVGAAGRFLQDKKRSAE